MDSNLPWSEQFRVVSKKWVDAEAAASLLEDTKSAVLSKMMLSQGDIPNNRAEMLVKASDEWDAQLKSINMHRQAANLLKVQLEYIRMKAAEWTDANATKRAEMRL